MLAKGPTIEEVQGVGSIAAGAVSVMSAQRAAGSHRAGTALGMVAQWSELADGTPVIPAMQNGGMTPSDPRALRWSGWH